MYSQENESTASELLARSFDEQIKQATDPILKPAGELCALLVGYTQLESAEYGEASSLRRDNTPISLSHTQHNMVTGAVRNPHRRNQLHGKTTVDNLTTSDSDQPGDNEDKSELTQLMYAITNVLHMVQRNTQMQKLLDTSSDFRRTKRTL